MKRTLIIAAIVALVLPTAAMAQTASGTLTVTATVQSSMTLVFSTAPAGVALGGNNTNAATLAFGNVSAYGTIATPNVTRSVNAADFTVSSPVLVVANKSNIANPTFRMQARVDVADTTVVTFGGVALTAVDQDITTAGAWGAAGNSETVMLTIPFTTAAGGINKVISVTATPN